MTNYYTITHVAKQTGLSAYTLRYYEQLGLITNVERAANGHRRYSDSNMQFIELVLYLRDTGLSLDDMVQFVSLYREGDETGTERYAILSQHRQAVQAKVDDLCNMLAYIDKKLAYYQSIELDVIGGEAS